MVKQITPTELAEKLKKDPTIELIDVRGSYEQQICSIGGKLIPVTEFARRFGEIDKNKEVIVYCRVGERSQMAAEFLIDQGYQNVTNLAGGILRWIDEVDPSLSKY